MKLLYTSLVALVLLASFSTNAAANAFTVRHYDVDIYLHETGYFDVVENYDVEFHQPRHGIIREIQTKYKFEDAEGKVSDRTIGVSNVEVPGHQVKENGALSRRLNGVHSMRIGDPNTKVTGSQQYQIKYRVTRAFIFEKMHVKFYWNVKPPEWDAPFERVDFRIHAPEGVEVQKSQTFVYAGVNQTKASEAFEYSWDGNVFHAKSRDGFSSREGESVTALMRLPQNAITDNTFSTPAWFGWFGFLLAPFLLLGYLFVWLKHGKDERPVVVTTYYPPEGIDPPMAGFIVDNKADPNDLLSVIPKWGADGKVQLEEVETKGLIFTSTDLIIHKLDTLDSGAPAYEQTIFDGLFPAGVTRVSVDSLKNEFHVHMKKAQSQLKRASRTFYDSDSDAMRTKVIGGTFAAMIILGALFFLFLGPMQAAAVVGACVIILLLNGFIERKNALGTERYGETLGFREFIEIADTDRIRMLIEEDPNYFEKTMSYAMAFGLLEKWAKKFDALNLEPPNWYHAAGAGVGMNSFARSFSSNMSSAQSAMVSTPSSSSSSGGGSSGGGFGGGGGSSW